MTGQLKLACGVAGQSPFRRASPAETVEEKADASSLPVVAPPGQARAEASSICPEHTKRETLVVETALGIEPIFWESERANKACLRPMNRPG